MHRTLLLKLVYLQTSGFDTPPKRRKEREPLGNHTPGLSFEGKTFKEQKTTFV